ncbi:MAG: hypothetical protein ABR551_00275 [Gemmatimonadales bacterium]
MSRPVVRSVKATIEVECVGDRVGFRLWPWVAHVNETAGDEIEWMMVVKAGTVAEYDIVPGNSSTWPFPAMVGNGKGKGRPTVPLQSGKLRQGAANPTPYKYTVQFDCVPAGATTPVRVVIDPDVVVD